jgi:hypothetical protein
MKQDWEGLLPQTLSLVADKVHEFMTGTLWVQGQQVAPELRSWHETVQILSLWLWSLESLSCLPVPIKCLTPQAGICG